MTEPTVWLQTRLRAGSHVLVETWHLANTDGETLCRCSTATMKAVDADWTAVPSQCEGCLGKLRQAAAP